MLRWIRHNSLPFHVHIESRGHSNAQPQINCGWLVFTSPHCRDALDIQYVASTVLCWNFWGNGKCWTAFSCSSAFSASPNLTFHPPRFVDRSGRRKSPAIRQNRTLFYQNEIANREHFKIKETRKLNRIVLTPDAVSGLVTARSYCVEQMHIRDYRCCSVLMLLLLPLTTIGCWLPGDRHASSSITETVGRDSAVLITSTPSHIACTTDRWFIIWNVGTSLTQ